MKEKTHEIFNNLYSRYPILIKCKADISEAFRLLNDCAGYGGTVMTCGNGGSAADSEHIVGELMKGFLLKRSLTDKQMDMFSDKKIALSLQQPIRAISLVSQSALITAFTNDVGADNVFAQQVLAYSENPYDLLIAMSTSGNSVNTVNAVITANACGIKSVAITGESGGQLEKYADVTIKLPRRETFEIQELTLPLYHALCAGAENEMFSE